MSGVMKKRERQNKKITINRYECAYCGACIAVCKFNANELVETFLIVNEDECALCLACVKTCPMRALEVQEVYS